MSLAEAITLGSLELTRFLIAIVSLLFSAHLIGHVFYRLGLPRVIGEITGGLLLGPTVFGFFSPGLFTWTFNAFESEGQLISLVSYFGLILLMFISGFEVQKSFSREDKELATGILLGATLLPFFIGFSAPYLFDFSPFAGPNGNLISLAIIIGIATAVTSIPVIAKIFLDLKILDTRFAKIVLAVATVEDIVLWTLLAVATGIAGAQLPSVESIIVTGLVTAGFFGFGIYILPVSIGWISGNASDIIRSSPSRFALFACFSLVAISSVLNINVVFGAFLAGVAIGRMPPDVFEKAQKQIKAVGLALFTPVYFGVVGLKLDLVHRFDPIFFLGFLLFSTAFKAVGTVTTGRLMRRDWLSTLNLAVALNTRGGPGIVLATIAFDLGIINEVFFVTLVLTAILTSLLAGYWFRHVVGKGWELLRS